MRYLLIAVIVFNVMDALGKIIGVFAQSTDGFVFNLGRSFDAALWPVSIAIIAIAVLRAFPHQKKADKF